MNGRLLLRTLPIFGRSPVNVIRLGVTEAVCLRHATAHRLTRPANGPTRGGQRSYRRSRQVGRVERLGELLGVLYSRGRFGARSCPATVRSTRGALPVFRPVGFPGPPPEPAVPVSGQRALHKPRSGRGVVLIPWPAREWGSLCPGSGSEWCAPSPG